jgi:tRNA threonylcarbamoyladenosine biosynthesis protein TsaE
MKWAERFSRTLQPGTVLALTGDLGTGKTTFIKGLARGLGLKDCDQVKSPTFALMHLYPADIPLIHFDLYRLEKVGELHAIGFEEYVNDPGAVICVEWAEKAGELIPSAAYHIEIRHGGGKTRHLDVKSPQP